jgi:hypothetical protein
MYAERADSDRLNDLSSQSIGCAFTVLNTLGTGFLEKVYTNARLCSSRVAERGVRQRQWAGLGGNNLVDTVTVGSILNAGCRSSPSSII